MHAEGLAAKARAEADARAKADAAGLEAKVRELETETLALRDVVRAAREQHTILKTIAKIRNAPGQGGPENGGPGGFDAMVQRVDSVRDRVDALSGGGGHRLRRRFCGGVDGGGAHRWRVPLLTYPGKKVARRTSAR